MTASTVLDWLLDSDPALRWQVERDLAHAPEHEWRVTRSRVATEGFGARLLALQDADGQWAGGAYFPRGFQYDPEPDGQPWTATTWSLNALREWGVDARALAGTAEKLAANSRWEYNDLPYWQGEVDCCVNGYTLANGAWLGADVSALADWFVEHRLADGGWNCEWVEGSTRSSVHSTLNSLEGILSFEKRTGGTDALRSARRGAQEYLLERRLLFSTTTGEPLGSWTDWFAYPFRWVASALHALDYVRAASVHDGVAPDPRLADAVEVVRGARRDDGRWAATHHLPGAEWFDVDAPMGEPSKWITFHATRVLDWWDAAR